MRKLLSVLLVTLAVVSCGGSDNTLVADPTPPVDPGEPAPPVLAKLSVLTSSPQIPSDGALPATITAQVQDADNNFVADVLVSFSADSGGIAVTQATTDASGKATATLETAGDPTNRIINVTARITGADGTVLTDTVPVAVIGTELVLTGPASLVLGDNATYTVVLTNANDDGIAGETVTVSSANGNAVSAAMIDTDTEGQAQFSLNASVPDTDTLTVSALGITTTRQIVVSNDSFAFVQPAPNTEIPLNTNQAVTVRWTQGGAPAVNQQISFSTTRGTVTPQSGFTNASGEVSVSISATNAGPATITATTTGGPTTQLVVEFVATDAHTIEVQADPFNIAPSERATVTAVVRDPNNNLVKNQTVVFELDDVSGGSLSVGQAVTDSQGRAQTFYTASPATSDSGGVKITAFVASDPPVRDVTQLTVARRELFFTFGTGNTIIEPNDTQYEMPFTVQVTDADGNGVPGVVLQMSVLSTRYQKGVWFADTVNDRWVAVTRATCLDEDTNRNGILDLNPPGAIGTGEDFNASGAIEAGNVATVAPGFGTSDENGFLDVGLFYAQQFGAWLEVELSVKTEVQGTEFREAQRFLLVVSADDVNSLDNAPPGPVAAPDPDPANDLLSGGIVSPFGYGFNCGDTI